MPYIIEKVKGTHFYTVYNAITGLVHSYHTTFNKATRQVRLLNAISQHGTGLKTNIFANLLKASYNPIDKVDNFELDKSISKTSKVYHDPNTGQTVVAHRGTSGASDWLNNLIYAKGGERAYKMTPRYKEAERVQRRAEAKYGRENISTIGHSQSGLQAELLGKDTKEIITLNKATRPTLFSRKKHKNQYDIRSERDIVSHFNPFERRTKRDITIPSKSKSITTEHNINILNRLDPDTIIGR